MRFILFTFFSLLAIQSFAQYKGSKFAQIEELLPTPNEQRTASGAPGAKYWQQKADYIIQVELFEKENKLKGKENITYYNNSPDVLTYIWLQLDQNIYDKNSIAANSRNNSLSEKIEVKTALGLLDNTYDGGYKNLVVTDNAGKTMKHVVNGTMMRIDLPSSLKSGSNVNFNIAWEYTVNNNAKVGGRAGFEFFEKDKNSIYEIAQWFPRMCVYSDYKGWQTNQYIGAGEFALTFGNYKVSITVPSDHIVASTGELQNPAQVLTTKQLDRWKIAQTAAKPIMIVTQDEAENAEKSVKTDKKTWIYKGDNVRDFAWASSRKFIWDAMAVQVGAKKVMAMSYYPKEGNPLWQQYSTESVAHTLRVYSKFTVDYPYPVAISVNGPIGGMEYPMISFNGARPESDGTYSENRKYGLISVIIHEVGHNYFPMIINSDEREWTWMDEGLNTFTQFLAEKEWDLDYPSRRGPARNIVDYMRSNPDKLEPIMTNSESVMQLGNNAYGKTATALNVLRETVLGRELFDFAFKEYARRWAFKHPTPADFFRTMEDASGVDLDWFWRGWFYSIDKVDISIDFVKAFTFNGTNPAEKQKFLKALEKNAAPDVSEMRNRGMKDETYIIKNPALLDFYNSFDQYAVTDADSKEFEKLKTSLNEEEKKLIDSTFFFYEVGFSNKGGLIMPLTMKFIFEDKSELVLNLPVEVWLKSEESFSKVFSFRKKVNQIIFDPYLESADVDVSNNSYPTMLVPSQYEIFKQQSQRPQGQSNPMRINKK